MVGVAEVVAVAAAVAGSLFRFFSMKSDSKAENVKSGCGASDCGSSCGSDSSGGNGGRSSGVGLGCGRGCDGSSNGGKRGSSSSSCVLLGRGGNHWAGAVKSPLWCGQGAGVRGCSKMPK